MKRSSFIKYLLGTTAMASAYSTLKNLSDLLPENDHMMPALFVGHGSPMNALEDNEFTQEWKKYAGKIPQPSVILCVSAHWLTKGTHVTAMQNPQTIHDFGGFPKQLYDVQYPAPGSPSFAKETAYALHPTPVGQDLQWGLDHGTWSVVKQMYPKANIPVIQLSIDYHQSGTYHYELARNLQKLRKKGVLILGSGNMVHNLGMVAFDRLNEKEYGYDWALEMNIKFKELIEKGDHLALAQYEKLGPAAKLAIPTPDHYYPLLYSLALQQRGEQVTFFNDKAIGGSLTMTSVFIA